jgi:hypothetical protein
MKPEKSPLNPTEKAGRMQTTRPFRHGNAKKLTKKPGKAAGPTPNK